MRGYPSFEMSFFQKFDVIWSLGHYSCSALGLVYRDQEKHFWALLIPKHNSSIKLGNILLYYCTYDVILCIFVIPNFQTENQTPESKYIKKQLLLFKINCE